MQENKQKIKKLSKIIKQANKAILAICLLIAPLTSHAQDFVIKAAQLNKIGEAQMTYNIEAALNSFEKAAQLNPFDDIITKNLATAVNAIAVKRLQNFETTEAIKLFERAKSHMPESIEIRLNLLAAFAAINAPENAEKEARELLTAFPDCTDETALICIKALSKTQNKTLALDLAEWLLKQRNSSPKITIETSRLLYETGQIKDAQILLSDYLTRFPSDNKAQRMLQRIKAEESIKNENLSREETSTLIVYYPQNLNEKKLCFLKNLAEEALNTIAYKLSHEVSEKPVFCFYEAKDFTELYSLPDWAGGLYNGKINIPIKKTSTRRSIRESVFHETSHHFVHLITAGNCPIWLNEGIAQYFEFGMPDTSAYLEQINTAKLELAFENCDEQDSEAVKRLYQASRKQTFAIINKYGEHSLGELLLAVRMSGSLKL
ncbi:MAG: hypothetical protein GX221_08475 [Candidatus Riflebacteria bacterium]|nr:hypothetical protein [Candidatus Riflebacteria bacterium]